ncbi:hypothetical protein VDT04_003547 [Vibrio cholerae]|uniref:hypothetical protein n=1 Tax=Vibrio sp. V01_P9A10T6 TaxID=2116368 RepID=UPI000D4A8DA6|nr:hypothetical protein [Vibrio sp. V01_P9A10T6]EMC4027220.1 hypothetical protein [Vibrio cholerae]PRQ61593.1 hypothetical protein BWR16_14790 [Vibrio sp. V01_P9A10T6]
MEQYQFFIQGLISENWKVSVSSLIVLAVFSIRPILHFLYEMKRSRYKSLKGSIDSGCLEPNETEYLSKLAAREQFWLATGLWADSSFRKLAIDVDSDEDINVTFRQIVLAKEHITERDGIFIVSVSKSDRFKAKFDTWFSNISMFMSLCCFLFSFAAVLIVGWNAFILIAFSIYFAFLGILSASSSIHTNVAIRITPELEKLHNKRLKGTVNA